MRKLLLILLFTICHLLSFAQTRYEVTAKTSLNIRTAANPTAPVLGKVSKGGYVTVYEIQNGWAKIYYGGTYGYVSANYICLSPQVESVSAYQEEDAPFWEEVGGMEKLVFLILALSAVLFFFRMGRKEDEPLEGGFFVVNWILFCVISVIEIFYVLSMGSGTIWFCKPGEVGWIWTIVDFVLFGFVVYNQLLCFFNVLSDVQYNSCALFDWRWGIFSWPIAAVAGIVCQFFYKEGLIFVGTLFLICQLIQIILIFTRVVPRGGWGYAFLCTIIYLLGSVATVAILAHFLVLLIIVLIGLLILSSLGSRRSPTREEYNDEADDLRNEGRRLADSDNTTDYEADNWKSRVDNHNSNFPD